MSDPPPAPPPSPRAPRPSAAVSRSSGAAPTPSPRTPRPSVGGVGEDLAAAYLEARGYRIVARNWRTGTGELRGELDIVAARDGVVAFVEVKTRRGDGFGGPLLAVTPRKQAKIRALARVFLRDHRRAGRVRFDVVAVWLRPGAPPVVRHLPGVF